MKVGGLRWLKENDPDAYREKYVQYKSKYIAKNREAYLEKARRYSKKRREEKREYIAAYRKNWYAKNPEYYAVYNKKRFAKNRGQCPLCLDTKWSPAQVMCLTCTGLLRFMFATRQQSREDMLAFTKNLTEGELKIWRNAITLRKATKPLQGLLKRPGRTQSSPTSEKTKKSSSS